MDYREEIVKALSRVFYSDCGRYYTGVACGIEPISLSCNTNFVADVDAAVAILNKHVWTFRTNNSDAAAKGLKMPPEIGVILSLLGRCVRIFDRIKSEIHADRDAWRKWDARTAVFVTWETLIRQYYPPVASTTEQGEKHRPEAKLADFLVGVDEDSFKREIAAKVQGKKGTAIGGVMASEVKKGRLKNKRGYIIAFLRAFGVEDQLQGVYKYFRRRPDFKVYDDGVD